ncbi:hypothetical protein [Streptomyces sp. NPDC006384]|uniref:hypothetical protein n=1 Tax=Streptomyces sp. NPDC006384 TaxID=3364745 RepID=UPI003690060E
MRPAPRPGLVAIGRTSFADTSYDALPTDDTTRPARVAKSLIHHCFRSGRGCYPAIIQDPAAGPVTTAVGGTEPPAAERVHRTTGGCLSRAEPGQAARRAAVVSGGVGFDAEVRAVRDGVREAIVGTVAESAYDPTDTGPPPPPRPVPGPARRASRKLPEVSAR